MVTALALAKSLLSQAQSGQFDRSELTPTMSAALTQEQITALAGRMSSLGKPSSFAFESTQNKNGLTKYTYRVTFAEAAIDEQVVLNSAGKVAGLWFTPAPVVAAAGDASALALAKSLLRQAQRGDFDRTLFTAQLNADLTAATAKDVASELAPLGAPSSFKLESRQNKSDVTVYLYRVIFRNDVYLEEVVLDRGGKVAGLWFKPA
jgi:hypothetical protein